MPPSLRKAVILIVGIGFLSGSVICHLAHAESKSELIKRLRNENCTDDVTRGMGQLARFKQLQLDIEGLSKAAQSNAPSIATSAQKTEPPILELTTALSSHTQSKQTICQRLKPQEDTDASDYPEGYQDLSKSERIERLKKDYCDDVKTNGSRIRQAVPLLTETMTSLMTGLKNQGFAEATADRVRTNWEELSVTLKSINHEQIMADKICTGMSEGISKSELISISRQGLDKGGQLPHFWYILKFD